MQVTGTCFTATGPDGHTYPVFGRRFSGSAPTSTTPIIVLVHGVASNADIWDITPKLSVARRLARAGYVVLAYDRLGYRWSPYDGTGGAEALTVSVQQAVLHDIVSALHTGEYRVGVPDGDCDPTADGRPSGLASQSVALIGHSSGGFIVSSYPGRYHDVDAMVQANAPSGLVSAQPIGNAALLSATAPDAHGAQDDEYGPIGDTSHDHAPPPAPSGYNYDPGPDRVPCEEFSLWRSRADRAAATVLCNPANATPTPRGETDSYPAQAVLNNALIRRTGDIPVLLAGTDRDAIMPGDANALELAAWQQTCGCDVSQFIVYATGHAFMAHTTLGTWTRHVVRWLHSRL